MTTNDTTSDAHRVMTDGGTPRNKIAERVASRAADTVSDELDRWAADRLDDDAHDELVDAIHHSVEKSINGRLKLEAAEKYDHDIVTDGGQVADEQVPAEDKFNDVVSMITSEYAAISIEAELMRCEVSGSDDDAPELGLTVIQDGRHIGLSAGTNNREFGQTPDIHTHHGLTREQARALRDGLDQAIENVESFDDEPDPDPRSIVDRLREVVGR